MQIFADFFASILRFFDFFSFTALSFVSTLLCQYSSVGLIKRITRNIQSTHEAIEWILSFISESFFLSRCAHICVCVCMWIKSIFAIVLVKISISNYIRSRNVSNQIDSMITYVCNVDNNNNNDNSYWHSCKVLTHFI